MRPLITAPEAWKSAEFADPRSYTLTLSASQIGELDERLDRLEPRPFEELRLSDFALPAWASLFDQINADLKEGRGFALLRGLPVKRWGKARSRLAVWGISLHVGQPVSQTVAGSLMCDVLDTTRGEPSPRQFKTNRELSLHTDPVSDLIGLACLQPAESGGTSVLASAATIYNDMCTMAPDLLEELFAGFYVHRFGEGRLADAPVTDDRIPMLAFCEGRLVCRYVRTTIVAGHKETGHPLTPSQIAALDFFDARARAADNALRFDLEMGDMVLVNNLAVLHARTAFTDFAAPERVRHLLRMWLKGPAGFRQVPRQMNYFNDGECGIPVRVGGDATYDITRLTQADGLSRNTVTQ